MANRKKTIKIMKKSTRHNLAYVCEYCGAKAARKAKLNHTFGRGARMIVVTNVDTMVCENCGQSYVEGEALKRLDKILSHSGDYASIERVAVVDFSKAKLRQGKAIKEIDFSKAMPNKYYGRPKVVIGDRRFARRPNPSDKLFRFLNTRIKRSVDIRAANKREARLAFLEQFNLKRMPPGFVVTEIKLES